MVENIIEDTTSEFTVSAREAVQRRKLLNAEPSVTPMGAQRAEAADVYAPRQPEAAPTPNAQPQPDPILFETEDPQSTDPAIVQNQLSGDPVLQQVNKIVYGAPLISEVMSARETGDLQRMIDGNRIKVAPFIGEMQSATGLNPETIGYFLLAHNSPRLLGILQERIGASNVRALIRAKERIERRGAEEERGGFLASVGGVANDVGGLVTKNDFVDAARTGAAGFVRGVNSLGNIGNWSFHVAGAIDSIPGVSQASEFIGLTTLGMDFTPQSQEDIDRLRAAIPNYSHTWAGRGDGTLDNLQVGVRKRLHMNPKEWRAFNKEFGFEGYEANMASIKEIEDKWSEYIDTTTGEIMSVITEYGLTYATTPAFVKGAGFGVRAVNGLLKGAVTDSVVYEEGDGNVSSMLVSVGAPGSELLEATLAVNDSDNKTMQVVKTATEGAVLGVAVETLGFLVIAIKNARAGKSKEAFEGIKKAAESEAENAELSAQKLLKEVEDALEEGRQVDQAQAEIAEAARRAQSEKVTKETVQFDYDKMPDEWNREDTSLLKAIDKFIRTGRVTGADAVIIKTVLGADWLKDSSLGDAAKIYTEDAEDTYAQVAQRFALMFAKIQEPTTINTLRGMGVKLLGELDEDMLDPDLLYRFKNTDPADWSTNDAANLFAAGMLQRTYVEQMQQIATDIATNGDVMDSVRLVEQGKRLDALQAQIAILQGGRAKMARNASHAMLALKAEKKATRVRDAQIANATWMHQRNLISTKRKAALIAAAMSQAKNARARAKVANEVSTKTSKLEKILHVSNANLLFNTSTQALMIFGNAFRAIVRNPMIDFIEGLVVEPMTGILGDKKAWGRAGKALQRGFSQYGMLVKAAPKAFQAFGKFWHRGKSQFTKNTMFDERGYYANKSLAEVRASKAEGDVVDKVLDQGMKASEHIYRFMGSVDEMFKELVVSMEMGVRAKTGGYGPELMAIATKRLPTDAEFAKWIGGAGEDLVERNAAGRFVDKYAKDIAVQTTFQSEAVEGSMNKYLRDMLNKNNSTAQLIRLFAMRFVATPLNVMEERFATLLAGPLMIFGDTTITRLLAGKFAADLSAVTSDGLPDMRIRQRTRASLMVSNMFMAMGMLSALGFFRGQEGGDDIVDVDPDSPTFGNIKMRWFNGKRRMVNVMDLELPFANAFVMGRVAAEMTRRMRDPRQATEFIDGVGALMAIYVNETLEKSSLSNLTDTIAMITDDKFRGGGNLIAGNVAAFVPFNWWMTRAMDLGNQGEFDGKPLNFVQALGKRIPLLRPFVAGTANKERNALGEIVPSNSRGIQPFIGRAKDHGVLEEELADISLQTGVTFNQAQFERDDIAFHEITVGNRSLFDLMQESIASGDVKIQGLTLREMAMKMVTDPDSAYNTHYAEWSAGILAEPRNSEGDLKVRVGGRSMKDPRIQRWRDLLTRYREAALSQLELDDETQDRIRTLQRTSTTFSDETLQEVLRQMRE